jgi:hypothetical protein
MSFLKQLIQGLNVAPDAINYAVGFWAQTSKKLLPLTGDKTAVTKLDLSAKARTVGDSTYMDEGFDMAGEFLAASTRRQAAADGHGTPPARFCVMLTDGSPTSRGLADTAAKKLKAQGVTVIVILIGSGISVADVANYVSAPAMAIKVSDFNALDKAIGQITADIAKHVCSQTTAVAPVVATSAPRVVSVPIPPVAPAVIPVTPPAVIPVTPPAVIPVTPPAVIPAVVTPPAVQPASGCGSMADIALVSRPPRLERILQPLSRAACSSIWVALLFVCMSNHHVSKQTCVRARPVPCAYKARRSFSSAGLATLTGLCMQNLEIAKSTQRVYFELAHLKTHCGI